MIVSGERLTSWQAEYAGTSWLPPIGAALALFAVLAVLLVSLLGGPQAVAEEANEGKPPTLCEEHAGRPGWDAVCR
jgi:hypothetical protein